MSQCLVARISNQQASLTDDKLQEAEALLQHRPRCEELAYPSLKSSRDGSLPLSMILTTTVIP
ncbi:hypothetical protein E4U35_002314, partial [Claviceps purpurea]